MPSWGIPALLWGAMGWKSHYTETIERVLELPFPANQPNHNEMSIIAWNVRGAGNSNFVTAANDLVNRYNPTIMVLTETRVHRNRAEKFLRKLPFDS